MISPATHLIQCDGLRDGQQCRRSQVLSVPLAQSADPIAFARAVFPHWRIGSIHALCPECQARGLATLQLSSAS